jgi:hypothetical protein
MHCQARVGAGEIDLVIAEERSLKDLLSGSGVREWWSQNPYAFGAEFRSYIEVFLAKRQTDLGHKSAAAQHRSGPLRQGDKRPPDAAP